MGLVLSPASLMQNQIHGWDRKCCFSIPEMEADHYVGQLRDGHIIMPKQGLRATSRFALHPGEGGSFLS